MNNIVMYSVAGAVGFFGIVLPVLSMNSLPTKDENVKRTWANVESNYERRADLIPQLIGVVKSASNDEIRFMTAALEQRAAGLKSEVKVDIKDPEAVKVYSQNQNALTTALTNMKMVVEKYPEFKANANYRALQSQVEGTENRINVARRDYNNAVNDLNVSLRTYPGVLANMVVGIKPAESFVAGGSQGMGHGQAAPKPMETK